MIEINMKKNELIFYLFLFLTLCKKFDSFVWDILSSVRVPSHDMVCLKFIFESFDGVILVTFNGRILGPFLGSSRFESESEYHHIMTIYGLGHLYINLLVGICY